MSRARGLVSKKKKRFVDKANDIDLDLTYITPRVIAMGFPSVGKEAMFRNPLPAVQKFFEFRSNKITDREEWSQLISNDKPFVLTQPPLPFRKYNDFDGSGQFYRCRGIDGLIADTAVVESAMARIAATRGKVVPNTRDKVI